MTSNQNQLPEAYAGKYINIMNKQYRLAPEVVSKGCRGCAFENRSCLGAVERSTKTNMIDYCRQGFILKEVKL